MKKQGRAKRSKSKRRPTPPVETLARQRSAVGPIAADRKPHRPRPAPAPIAARRLSVPLSAARAISRLENRDDRLALALLLAPFLIVTLSLGAERAARQVIARAPQFVTAAQSPAARPGTLALPAPPVRAPPGQTAALSPAVPGPEEQAPPPASLPPLAMLIGPVPPPLAPLSLLIEPALDPLPSLARLVEPPLASLPATALLIEPTAVAPPSLTQAADVSPGPLPPLALLIEPPPPAPPAIERLAGRVPDPTICVASAPPETVGAQVIPSEAADFGRALSAAARAQLSDFVIYNPKYLRIGYPMGDVPPLFGVCTDVVVRAYRALGIDLQALIQQTGSGRGDRNIDHRRVEVLRRFLARHGATLPVSDLAEDYQPGDIVTYYRPQNRGSTSHMAIVTDQIAPSGRPMVVHNRGWGPELEDALFVDKITGHYRFTGLATGEKSEPAAKKRRVAGH